MGGVIHTYVFRIIYGGLTSVFSFETEDKNILAGFTVKLQTTVLLRPDGGHGLAHMELVLRSEGVFAPIGFDGAW